MSARNCLLACVILALAGGWYTAPSGVAQEKKAGKEPGKKPAVPEPATFTVEKGPFKIEVACKGIFEAETLATVAFSPEAWSPQTGGPLVVQRVVEHGTRVNKGDPLIWLDLERIDQAIRDLEAERHLAESSIVLAEKELPLLAQSTPKELAAAERARKIADEDLDEFTKRGRAFTEKLAEFRLKSARQYLEYAQEELRQLEKMYKANDLTEETEEIVLRRYRNSVEGAAFFLKVAERDRDQVLKIDLPRRDQMLRETAERQTLSLEKAQATLPLLLSQKQLTLSKLKYDRDKTGDRLAKLKRDRTAMTAKAPASGIVYYGRCVRGQWTTAAQMADRLQRGSQLQAEEVLLTIVEPKGLFVRAELEEKDLHYIRPGMDAKVVATAFPDLKLKAKVDSVSTIPVTPGKFLARAAMSGMPAEGPVTAGMACTLKLLPYAKAEALSLPASAVFTDDLDEDKHYVYLPGESAKRYVQIGKKTADRVQILEGLKAGAKVLQQKPGEASKTPLPKEDK